MLAPIVAPVLRAVTNIGKPNKGRSPKWPAARKAYLLTHPTCEACGGTDMLEVHHRKPFHLYPALELDPANFITLCEHPARNCHFAVGHCLNWKDWNPFVRDLAAAFLSAMRGRLVG